MTKSPSMKQRASIFDRMKTLMNETQKLSLTEFVDLLTCATNLKSNEKVIALAFKYVSNNLEPCDYCKEIYEVSKKELLEKCVEFSLPYLEKIGAEKPVAITTLGKIVKTMFPKVGVKRVTNKSVQTYCFTGLGYKQETLPGYSDVSDLPEYSKVNTALPAYSEADPSPAYLDPSWIRLDVGPPAYS